MNEVLGPVLVVALTAVILVELLRRLPLVQAIGNLMDNVRRGSQVIVE